MADQQAERAETAVEKEGLKSVAENRRKNFYREETLGGKKVLHRRLRRQGGLARLRQLPQRPQGQPRKDFKLGDVMGGVVIWIPVN